MKKLLIIALLVVGCENSTEPQDAAIALPTEFPLVHNTGWVYKLSEYSNANDFLLGNNATITYDTLVAIKTTQDYYIYSSISQINESNSAYTLYKNYDNKFVALGDLSITTSENITLYEKPYIMADYSLNFDADSIDTNIYTNYIIGRTTEVDTLFDNLYNTYVFEMRVINPYREVSMKHHYNKEGLSLATGYIIQAENQSLDDSYSTMRLIEKLNNFEINIP